MGRWIGRFFSESAGNQGGTKIEFTVLRIHFLNPDEVCYSGNEKFREYSFPYMFHTLRRRCVQGLIDKIAFTSKHLQPQQMNAVALKMALMEK